MRVGFGGILVALSGSSRGSVRVDQRTCVFSARCHPFLPFHQAGGSGCLGVSPVTDRVLPSTNNAKSAVAPGRPCNSRISALGMEIALARLFLEHAFLRKHGCPGIMERLRHDKLWY